MERMIGSVGWEGATTKSALPQPYEYFCGDRNQGKYMQTPVLDLEKYDSCVVAVSGDHSSAWFR